MSRTKTVVPGRARRKKVLKAAKGGYSGRSKLFKTALQTQPRAGTVVLVRGDRISAVGLPSELTIPPGTETIDLPNLTLLPGLIDAHSHVLLHPYNETSWDDQVLKETSPGHWGLTPRHQFNWPTR